MRSLLLPFLLLSLVACEAETPDVTPAPMSNTPKVAVVAPPAPVASTEQKKAEVKETCVLRGNTGNIRGNTSRICGDVSGLYGDVTQLSGDVSNIDGLTTDISGDVSDLAGDISDFTGAVSNFAR